MPNWQPRQYSEETAGKIDRAVLAIVARCFERAVAILRLNRQKLDDAARELLAHETLVEDRLQAIAAGLRAPPANPPPVAPAQPGAVIHRL
jgi:cell division protease FtsH